MEESKGPTIEGEVEDTDGMDPGPEDMEIDLDPPCFLVEVLKLVGDGEVAEMAETLTTLGVTVPLPFGTSVAGDFVT